MGKSGRKPGRPRPLNESEEILVREFRPHLPELARQVVQDALGRTILDDGTLGPPESHATNPQNQAACRRLIVEVIQRDQIPQDAEGTWSQKELEDKIAELVAKSQEEPDMFSRPAAVEQIRQDVETALEEQFAEGVSPA